MVHDMMIQLCTNTPIPTCHSLIESIRAQLPTQIPQFEIPDILGLPVPIYPDLSSFELEFQQIIQALQSFQLSTTLLNVVKPLVAFLGGALNDLLPKIPGLPFNLLDLVELDADVIYTAIKQAIEDQATDFLALLPLPLFDGLSIPSIEIHNIVKMIKSYAMTLVLDLVNDLVSQVTDILQISNGLALLQIPSLSQIKDLILAAFPDYANIRDLLQSGIDIKSLFSALNLPIIPVLPDPFLMGIKSPEIEFNELLTIFYTEFIASQISVVVDFVSDALGILGFEFPTICIMLNSDAVDLVGQRLNSLESTKNAQQLQIDNSISAINEIEDISNGLSQSVSQQNVQITGQGIQINNALLALAAASMMLAQHTNDIDDLDGRVTTLENTPPPTTSTPEFNSDPVSPNLGDTWVLRSIANQAGTIQFTIGGLPFITESDQLLHQLSVQTTSGVKRVELT